jgi:hypothetical protein
MLTAFHRICLLALLLCTATGLSGCVESLPTSALPTLAKDDRKLLSKEEQTAAIGDLTRRKDSESQAAGASAVGAAKP